jgi:hypothetical protein
VDLATNVLSAVGAEQIERMNSAGPSGLKRLTTPPTPSRTWLLSAGPSGLKACSKKLDSFAATRNLVAQTTDPLAKLDRSQERTDNLFVLEVQIPAT